MSTVDINADLGESFGAYTLGHDAEIMRCVTSANVACGFHAGDPVVMERTVSLAKAAGVAVGAHPGYPDLQGFGRRKLAMSAHELQAAVVYQLGALRAFLEAQGLRMQHVKLHGALYNLAAADEALSLEICQAIRAVDPGLAFYGLAGSAILRAAEQAGLQPVSEVFADRAYNEDGTLVSRSLPGAVLHDPALVAQRVISMVREGTVCTITGKTIRLRADSICVHGDNADAVALAQRIRQALEREGIVLRAPGRA